MQCNLVESPAKQTKALKNEHRAQYKVFKKSLQIVLEWREWYLKKWGKYYFAVLLQVAIFICHIIN